MASMKILFVLELFLGLSLAFLLDDNSLQDLISLISQEKKMRVNFEKELQALQHEVQLVKDGPQSLSLCDCPTTTIIAFAATITNDITNFGTNQTVVFDNVITNVGGAYDDRHGTFRAPVSGIYQFSISILQGQSTMWLGVELVEDGKVIARIKTGDNGYWNMGSNVINVHLTANTDVWVRHMSDSDNRHLVADNGYFTSFSGHIIHADK